ncbi:Uncharacterised protein [Chryseobacterium nakagawai]|uniref:LuxR family transcriptional regulator n=1 Tax=Chryseobacterium nakagawai TaxID=1241982 RepID=A0AAD0YPM6_CHRNA|nr:LuxR family transcriptional regulator [Chryseobacterium nakagawai]AZA93015.1 LuxR family transcriptional regulator [Chryseobacterium nakagawai]VEH19645.1 Uncharacterised protein [Chryseobacterium nakagawai]
MTIRIYPGMIDQSKEYFYHENDVFVICNGTIKKFEDVSEHPELKKIVDEDLLLNDLLTKYFGDNELIKLKVLAGCRFGGLNFVPDFSKEDVSNDSCECIYRGSCEGENVICKPMAFKGKQISTTEIELLKELSTNDKNSKIASDLNIPIGTFNKLKTSIYQKFDIVTKQQLTKELYLEGLL